MKKWDCSAQDAPCPFDTLEKLTKENINQLLEWLYDEGHLDAILRDEWKFYLAHCSDEDFSRKFVFIPSQLKYKVDNLDVKLLLVNKVQDLSIGRLTADLVLIRGCNTGILGIGPTTATHGVKIYAPNQMLFLRGDFVVGGESHLVAERMALVTSMRLSTTIFNPLVLATPLLAIEAEHVDIGPMVDMSGVQDLTHRHQDDPNHPVTKFWERITGIRLLSEFFQPRKPAPDLTYEERCHDDDDELADEHLGPLETVTDPDTTEEDQIPVMGQDVPPAPSAENEDTCMEIQDRSEMGQSSSEEEPLTEFPSSLDEPKEETV